MDNTQKIIVRAVPTHTHALAPNQKGTGSHKAKRPNRIRKKKQVPLLSIFLLDVKKRKGRTGEVSSLSLLLISDSDINEGREQRRGERKRVPVPPTSLSSWQAGGGGEGTTKTRSFFTPHTDRGVLLSCSIESPTLSVIESLTCKGYCLLNGPLNKSENRKQAKINTRKDEQR